MEGNNWHFLEEPHAHRVLILILQNPGTLRSTLYGLVSGASRPTVQKRVDELIAADLIRVEQSKTHKAGQHLFLTEQGRQIAELAILMKTVMDGGADESDTIDYGTPSKHGDTVKS